MPPRILIYLLRRDLRIADNPILHEISQLASSPDAAFTHLLPVYVFPANQIELSGLISAPHLESPYPEARSEIGNFWRCGHHRARFLAESVWELKDNLEQVGCGLLIRAGLVGDVVREALDWYADSKDNKHGTVTSIWMAGEFTIEEVQEQDAVQKVAEEHCLEFKLRTDEKYFVDDRDLPFTDLSDVPDVYTTFRKVLEPLRDRPRPPLPTPTRLPPLPPTGSIPPQPAPFTIPSTLPDLIDGLLKPLDTTYGLQDPPRYVETPKQQVGGEPHAHERITYLLENSCMTHYKETRNGLLGEDYSTRLSAYLALGCITARQIHAYLLGFETGSSSLGKDASGYGRGENPGTAAVRFELVWRDYMRLCARKYGKKLFHVGGFKGDSDIASTRNWLYVNQGQTRATLERFLAGRTGIGLIDASNRELYHTGYTSNRARQNVASYLSAHLGIDWRLGAEWYECMLLDYDAANNWGNWQYVSGVGNDPRLGRTFNPVKQALDYDPQGAYVKAWIPELRDVDVDGGVEGGEKGEEMLMGLFQAWRLSDRDRARPGLTGVDWVERPLTRIPFAVGRRPREGGATWRGSSEGGGRSRGRPGRYRGRSRGDYSRSSRGNSGIRGRWRMDELQRVLPQSTDPDNQDPTEY